VLFVGGAARSTYPDKSGRRRRVGGPKLWPNKTVATNKDVPRNF